MQIIRGTTPSITITVTNEDIDLSTVSQVWVYIAQQNKPKVDKDIDDVVIDPENKTIVLRLEQTDTLNLRAGDAYFQIRMLLEDTTALATIAQKLTVVDVYKNGEITEEEPNE